MAVGPLPSGDVADTVELALLRLVQETDLQREVPIPATFDQLDIFDAIAEVAG